jgi:hypothetical protein
MTPRSTLLVTSCATRASALRKSREDAGPERMSKYVRDFGIDAGRNRIIVTLRRGIPLGRAEIMAVAVFPPLDSVLAAS